MEAPQNGASRRGKYHLILCDRQRTCRPVRGKGLLGYKVIDPLSYLIPNSAIPAYRQAGAIRNPHLNTPTFLWMTLNRNIPNLTPKILISIFPTGGEKSGFFD